MKMRGTYLQTQHGPGHRLAGFGATGFGGVVWILNRIFLTPRPARIGLSGLLLWVGLAGVCLADQAPNAARNPADRKATSVPPSGAIKDPFNPQGYMVTLATKMGSLERGDAILRETGLQGPRPATVKPAPAIPATKQVTWMPLGNHAAPLVLPKPPMSQTKWLSPGPQVAQTPAPPPANWQPSGNQVAQKPAAPAPPAGQMGWRPSSNQAVAKPALPEPPMSHTKWLSPGPQVARTPAPPQAATPQANWQPSGNQVAQMPAPSAPSAGQMGWQPPSNRAVAQPAVPEPPMSHAKWLSPGTQVARTPARPEPVMPQTSWPSTSRPAPQPEPATNHATWQPSDAVVAKPPVLSERATNQTTWLASENRAAQLALGKIEARKSEASEAYATSPAYVTDNQTRPSMAERPPQLTPRQLSLPGPELSPQMALLSGAGADPRTIFPATYAATEISQAKHFYEDPERPWSLGADLDKYRDHAVREGSRDSGQNLKKALERIGLAVEDTTNVITLGYASDRGQPFRANDGKGLFDEPNRVPRQAGATVASLGDGLYSLADLVTLNALPDSEKDVYRDNHPIVRPLIFTGRTIGGAWKTTEEIGNAVTWGYFDNVTGTIGMCIEDLIEILKHAGQAVTNLARVPVHLIAGKDDETDKPLDWVLLVPLEFVSNVLEMKGISNTDDYETAFADKGVIGSMLELGGSTFIVYRAVDELVDELKDDNRKPRQTSESSPEAPPEPEVPAEVPDTSGLWTDFIFTDGGVWTGTTTR